MISRGADLPIYDKPRSRDGVVYFDISGGTAGSTSGVFRTTATDGTDDILGTGGVITLGPRQRSESSRTKNNDGWTRGLSFELAPRMSRRQRRRMWREDMFRLAKRRKR